MRIVCLYTQTFSNMERIYILQLIEDKYYVGKSKNIPDRYRQHIEGYGSAFTQKYKPIKLKDTRPIKSEFDEDNVVKELMKKYGIDNVRGGSYSSVYLTDSQKECLQIELFSASNACFTCGKVGHFAAECTTRYIVKWSAFSQLEECDNEKCFRCGRTSHYAKDCFAKYHVNGYILYDSDED